MKGDTLALSPQFTDVAGQQDADTIWEAYCNLVTIEDRIVSVQEEAGATAVRGADTNLGTAGSLQSVHAQAAYDFEVLSSVEIPIEVPSDSPQAAKAAAVKPTAADKAAQASLANGLAGHIAASRAQRADEAVEERVEPKFDREKATRLMDFYVKFDGRLFSWTISARRFSELPKKHKLILGVALVNSGKFASVFNTEQKVAGYLKSMVNKGRKRDDEEYVDAEGLQELIAEQVAPEPDGEQAEEQAEEGMLALGKRGPVLTPKGMDYLLARKKNSQAQLVITGLG